MQEILLKDLGHLPYLEAFEIQNSYFEAIKAIKLKNKQEELTEPTPNYFLFTSHPHVYTLGKSGDARHLLLQEEGLKKHGVTFVKSNRGGDITYHGPGQIIGYPIIDLDNFYTDIHKYLRMLEEVIILTLADYGIKGMRSEGETGVWLDVGTPFARKICAMGVRTSRWVTMHGFALNVSTDLSYFDHIIPCGIVGKGVTSMERELNKAIDKTAVKKSILKHFAAQFEAEFNMG